MLVWCAWGARAVLGLVRRWGGGVVPPAHTLPDGPAAAEDSSGGYGVSVEAAFHRLFPSLRGQPLLWSVCATLGRAALGKEATSGRLFLTPTYLAFSGDLGRRTVALPLKDVVIVEQRAFGRRRVGVDVVAVAKEAVARTATRLTLGWGASFTRGDDPTVARLLSAWNAARPQSVLYAARC